MLYISPLPELTAAAASPVSAVNFTKWSRGGSQTGSALIKASCSALFCLSLRGKVMHPTAGARSSAWLFRQQTCTKAEHLCISQLCRRGRKFSKILGAWRNIWAFSSGPESDWMCPFVCCSSVHFDLAWFLINHDESIDTPRLIR